MSRRWFLTTVLALVLTITAAADTTIYVTTHGKHYHTRRDCIALRAAKPEHVSARSLADVYGLDLCPICARRKPSKEAKR